MQRNTLLISLNEGISIRSILQSDIFPTLKKSGIKIVILTPNAEDENFQKKYCSENIFFEKLEMDKYRAYFHRRKIQRLLKPVRWFTLNGKYDISTINDWYQKMYKKERPSRGLRNKIRNFIEDSLIKILRSSKILRKFLIKLESLFFTPSYHSHVFLKHKPDFILLTSLGFFDFDQYIMREGKRHRTKIISAILSWDNTSTRGMAGASPDHVIAWTDIMKKELVELHDIDPEKIVTGGVAQFDHYYKKESIYFPDKFYSHFKLSPERKLIFFATKSPTAFPWNPNITELIADAIENDKFVYPCQLLVRLHPIHFRRRGGELKFKHTLDQYDKISRRYKYVYFNSPHLESTKISFDMPETELSDVASIFHYSDVMINLFSTMNIEASIFDLPIINICFNGGRHYENETPRDIKIDQMQTHNQRIVKTGGIRLVNNKDELIDLINMYLMNPEMDREGRRKIVEQECGPNHGDAGEKIAHHIIEIMNDSSK